MDWRAAGGEGQESTDSIPAPLPPGGSGRKVSFAVSLTGNKLEHIFPPVLDTRRVPRKPMCERRGPAAPAA